MAHDSEEFETDITTEDYFMDGGKAKRRSKAKKGSKKAARKGSRAMRRTSRKASKGAKKSSKKASKKSQKRGSKARKGSRRRSMARLARKGSLKREQQLRLARSPGQNAYFDFLAHIKNALNIEGGVKFKMASYYKKKAEAANPTVIGEKIYKFAIDMFDSDNKDTKAKLIEKFKDEVANKPRKPRKSKNVAQ